MNKKVYKSFYGIMSKPDVKAFWPVWSNFKILF